MHRDRLVSPGRLISVQSDGSKWSTSVRNEQDGPVFCLVGRFEELKQQWTSSSSSDDLKLTSRTIEPCVVFDLIEHLSHLGGERVLVANTDTLQVNGRRGLLVNVVLAATSCVRSSRRRLIDLAQALNGRAAMFTKQAGRRTWTTSIRSLCSAHLTQITTRAPASISLQIIGNNRNLLPLLMLPSLPLLLLLLLLVVSVTFRRGDQTRTMTTTSRKMTLTRLTTSQSYL